MYLLLALMLLGVVPVLGLLLALEGLMRRNLHCWLPTYVREMSRRGDPGPEEEVHLLLCVADHFEPKGANKISRAGRELVQRWLREYPSPVRRFPRQRRPLTPAYVVLSHR